MNKPKIFDFNLAPKSLRVDEVIMYPAWEHAFDRVVSFAQLAPIGGVALVIGAGGAGKTSMCDAIGEAIYGEPSNWPNGCMPYVRVSADNPEKGYFTSKHLMNALLNAVRDPFSFDAAMLDEWDIDSKLKEDLRWAITRLTRTRYSEADMRRAFVSIARAVGLRLILIDEANLMCLTQANRIPTDFLESLRMLAQFSGCRIVLFGTIDLLGMIDYSAQLNRRGPRIHLDRMRFETDDQKLQFISFLAGLETELGLTEKLLVEHADEMAEFSYGIPGEIVGLLQRADQERAACGDSKIEWKHVEACRPLPDVLFRMQEEADVIAQVMAGEVQVNEKTPRARRGRPPGKRRPKRYETDKEA